MLLGASWRVLRGVGYQKGMRRRLQGLLEASEEKVGWTRGASAHLSSWTLVSCDPAGDLGRDREVDHARRFWGVVPSQMLKRETSRRWVIWRVMQVTM